MGKVTCLNFIHTRGKARFARLPLDWAKKNWYKNGRYQLLHELKDKKMHTAGAGHTYSNLLLWDSQFSKIIYNSY